MLQKDIRKELKKAGITFGETRFSGRVKGWATGASKGWEIGEVYPWYRTYIRNGYRLKGYLSCRTQEVTIKYSAGFSGLHHKEMDEAEYTTQYETIKNTLTTLGVKFEEKNGAFEVEVDNPYSEQVVQRAQEQWDRVTSRR